MKVQPPLLWPCILALALSNSSLAAHEPRQVGQVPPGQVSTPSQPAAPTTTPTTPAQPPTSAISQPPPDTSTTPTTTPTTTSQAPPTTSAATDTPSATSAPISPIVTAPPTTLDSTPTGSDTVTVILTDSPSQTSSSTALPTNTSKSDDDGGGLSTGSIVGMSVAAGIAVIGIVGFFVWKFTRKRFSDFDDNEAIKWPELNSHSGNIDTHPVPARETGRAGFDTGSEADLSRVNSASNYSNTDFSASGSDPYAVPPLPHLNPNQPYRDDPSASTGYYDPYRGPVPGTLENGAGDWQPEAYPMTQLGGPTGRASPAPEFTYQGGRQSPGPGAMYGRNSPVPQAPYGGRASPGPQALYGGRVSPGPQVAYAQGRASPGPNAGYDAYGAR